MCCLFLGQLRSNLDQKRFRLQTSEGSRLKGFHSGFRKVWLWIDLGIFLPSKQASCIRLVWQILAASLIPFFHITSPFKDGFSIDFIIFYPSKPICSYISQHFSISKQIFSYDSEYVPWIFWYFPSFLCPGLSPVLGPRWAKPREEGRTVTAAPWTWPKKWMVGKSCRKPTGFTYRFFHGLPHGTYFLFQVSIFWLRWMMWMDRNGSSFFSSWPCLVQLLVTAMSADGGLDFHEWQMAVN